MIIINNFIESLIVMLFLTLFLEKNSKYKHLYFLIFTIISTLGLTYFELVMPLEMFTTISLIIIEFIYCLLFTKRSVVEKMIACIYVELMIALIIQILILTVFNDNFSVLLEMNYDLQRNMIIVISKILLIIVLLLTVRKRREYVDDIENRYLSSVVIELITVYIISLFLSQLVFNYDVDYTLCLFIFILLLVLSVFIVINYVNQLIYYKELDDAKEEVLILEERVKSFNEIKSLNLMINSIRHDIKHQYAFIKNLVREKEYGKINTVIDNEIESLNELPRIHVSDNYVIDYLINKSISRAKENNLELRYQVNIYNDAKLSETELNAVLSNALDNAFENCSKNGLININISENAGYAEFRITNSTENDILKNNPDLESGKDGLHGFGINNIRRIVGSDGEVVIVSEENEFTIVIYIKLV